MTVSQLSLDEVDVGVDELNDNFLKVDLFLEDLVYDSQTEAPDYLVDSRLPGKNYFILFSKYCI